MQNSDRFPPPWGTPPAVPPDQTPEAVAPLATEGVLAGS